MPGMQLLMTYRTSLSFLETDYFDSRIDLKAKVFCFVLGKYFIMIRVYMLLGFVSNTAWCSVY